jgi:hypothetical protein
MMQAAANDAHARCSNDDDDANLSALLRESNVQEPIRCTAISMAPRCVRWLGIILR